MGTDTVVPTKVRLNTGLDLAWQENTLHMVLCEGIGYLGNWQFLHQTIRRSW